MSVFTQVQVTASSSCIGTGCPGTTGGSHAVGDVVGVLLILVGAALVFVGQRRDRRDRAASSELRAASASVTFLRAIGVLAAIIGLLLLIF